MRRVLAPTFPSPVPWQQKAAGSVAVCNSMHSGTLLQGAVCAAPHIPGTEAAISARCTSPQQQAPASARTGAQPLSALAARSVVYLGFRASKGGGVAMRVHYEFAENAS